MPSDGHRRSRPAVIGPAYSITVPAPRRPHNDGRTWIYRPQELES